ncbi:MAG: beta-eliminating lyase-related protein [Bacilli bacterium]
MLTDSGTNAMSDEQVAAMNRADDAYAVLKVSTGSGRRSMKFSERNMFCRAPGRACENILAKAFIGENSIIPMNYHFTTTLAHIMLNGGKVMEILTTTPFK